MIENDKKNQREIVQLHERIANSENSSKIQDVVVANYNKLRDSYQVEISKESKRRESLENENNLLRKHLTEQAYTIEELNTQIESLKQTIYNQNLVIDSLKSTKIYVDEPTRDLAPIKFDAPTGGLPLFEPKLQADPYSSAIRTFSPERETQIVPSPTKLGSAQKRESLEYDFNGRAGVKSKKHCTIDCIFSNKPCDQCGKGKDLKSQLNLIFRP